VKFLGFLAGDIAACVASRISIAKPFFSQGTGATDNHKAEHRNPDRQPFGNSGSSRDANKKFSVSIGNAFRFPNQSNKAGLRGRSGQVAHQFRSVVGPPIAKGHAKGKDHTNNDQFHELALSSNFQEAGGQNNWLPKKPKVIGSDQNRYFPRCLRSATGCRG